MLNAMCAFPETSFGPGHLHNHLISKLALAG
jgi:hypothetical protein